MEIKITLIDTACIIIEINGFRIMTDPVLDKAGKFYHFGYGSVSRKLNDPAVGISEIAPVDLVLLSHHQHQDNFDKEGQRFTKTVQKVVSTKNAAKKLGNAIGLNSWESHEILTDRVPCLKLLPHRLGIILDGYRAFLQGV